MTIHNECLVCIRLPPKLIGKINKQFQPTSGCIHCLWAWLLCKCRIERAMVNRNDVLSSLARQTIDYKLVSPSSTSCVPLKSL